MPSATPKHVHGNSECRNIDRNINRGLVNERVSRRAAIVTPMRARQPALVWPSELRRISEPRFERILDSKPHEQLYGIWRGFGFKVPNPAAIPSRRNSKSTTLVRR